jgi:RpiB/LacA/LacB family sugar-phosphate isomerase
MQLIIGADHAGYDLKQNVAAFVRELGHEVVDVGAYGSAEPDDYPDFAEALGMALRNHRGDRGILICGSGVGASVAVNKIPGIRAGLCHDTYSAHQGVEHDDMNVLVLGSRVIAAELAHDLVRSFLGAKFTGEERHLRRVMKVKNLETRFLLSPSQP